MAMQRTFAGGELSPTLYGGADFQQYASALRNCRNMLVMRGGGVQNRPGSQWVAEVNDSTVRARLIRFVYNADQTYILEFGHGYVRFFHRGAAIQVAGVPAWVDTTLYLQGALVSNAGVNYYAYNPHTAAASNEPGSGADGPLYWHPLSGTIYEIPTLYGLNEVQDIQAHQSGDVLTLTHPNHQPGELRRAGHTSWTMVPFNTQPSILPPVDGVGVAGAVGVFTYRYKVTAVQQETFEESTAGGSNAPKTITGATAANPVVITSIAHGLVNGDEVRIRDVDGMTELNGRDEVDGRVFTVDNVAADTFELLNENGLLYTAYVSGGTATPTFITIPLVAVPTPELPNVLTWTPVVGATEYNVYLDPSGNGLYGFVGIAKPGTFKDEGYQPDYSVTPPIARTLFTTAGNYPTAGGYYQQRQLFAGSIREPEKVFTSRVGAYHNFTKSSPIQDDDAIDFTAAAKEISHVRHLLEAGRLVMLTSTSEWVIRGGDDGVVRPTAINARQKTAYGSSTVSPAIIGDNIIAVQARGGVVRDYQFSTETDSLASRDLTVFASHLFEGFEIERMAFAQTPHSIVWAVRNDGVLLGLTYLKEFESYGWHRHDTDGFYEDVCVVPETTPAPPGSNVRGKEEDAVYVIVRRTINGVTKRYIERFASRRVEDYRLDGFFLDSFLTYNGVNATATTVTLTTATTYAAGQLLTVTASAASFSAGDVGNGITVWLAGVGVVRVIVSQYISTTVVKGTWTAAIPLGLQNVATIYWSRAVDELANLGHLEGKTVNVLANGVVLNGFVVTGGTITLPAVYDVIHVGLPIVADFETLDLDSPQETIRDKKKKISVANLTVTKSREGFKAGPDVDHLNVYAAPIGEALDTDIFGATSATVRTATVEIALPAEWNKAGRVFVRHTDPLPLTIVGIIPGGEMGG